MTSTDPIADMLTRVRNAINVRKNVVTLPHSKVKESVALLLKANNFIDDVKVTDLPVAIGFGIGTPAAARAASRFADGVIVGSAVVQLLETKDIAAVQSLLGAIRQELDKEGQADASVS